MFASSYFPNAYFPKTYFPECVVAGVEPATFGNRKNVPTWNKRVPTVRELLERERQERELALRERYDGKYLPVALPKEPSVFVKLSERSEKLLAELTRLQRQQEAEAILLSLQEQVRRLFLLGLYGE